MIVFAIVATAYDTYQNVKTLANPNASTLDKGIATGSLAATPVPGKGVLNVAKAGVKATVKAGGKITAWTAARNGRGTAVEAVQLKQYSATRNIKPHPINGRTRIHDNETTINGVYYIGETKGGKYQSWTSQLRDLSDYAVVKGDKAALFVPPSTRLSGPLLDAAKAGKITIFDDLLIK